MPRTVLIFAKPPRMGLSKTRLARSLGSPTEARRIAMMTMARTLRASLSGDRSGAWQTMLYVAPDSALQQSLGGLWPARLARRSQGRGDLTARLDKGLSQARPGPVLFIGSDAPDVSPAHIRRAFRLLQTHSAIFGPASDGGFWLFGINKTHRTRSPFRNVRWSTPHAMQDVRGNLPKGTKTGLLSELIDIDDADDWETWHGSTSQPSPL